MYRLFHLSNVELSILSSTPQFLWSNSKNEQEMMNHCIQWHCESSHIGSNQRLYGRPKRRFDGSSSAQPWLGSQWLSFISTHQENIACSTILAKHQFFLNSFFSSHCKQHKWWSYVKTFWEQLCIKMSTFPIKINEYRE